MLTTVAGIVLAGLIVWWLKEKAPTGVFVFSLCLLLGFAGSVVLEEAGIGYWSWGAENEQMGEFPQDTEQVQEHTVNEQLNMIVFNAISTDPARHASGTFAVDYGFYWTVNELKRILNDCSIDAREFWTNRRSRQRTQVLYQGARARDAAREIADLLPGNQDVYNLEDSTLWGIHTDRDIVMLLGRDAWYIRRVLKRMDETLPCPPLSALGTP